MTWTWWTENWIFVLDVIIIVAALVIGVLVLDDGTHPRGNKHD
jgi:hypothetical protein